MREYREEMNESDVVVQIGQGSVVQHGKQNDRVYLMKLAPEDVECVMDEIDQLAIKHGYSKLFCKIPGRLMPLFLTKGYIQEGYIPGFYNRTESAFFVSKYLNVGRYSDVKHDQLRAFYQLLCLKANQKIQMKETAEYVIRQLDERDAKAIAAIYSDVFESYPFPIYDPAYIKETMVSHVQYFGAFKDGRLAALSSAEIDFEAENAEMTDFATHKEHTGHNLSCLLLEAMEHKMQQQGIRTLYTIARLNSIPMNKTFIRLGYAYAGTLINNTNIAGQIESMNLYYKSI